MTEIRRAILVLGMHRSGTSAVARVLNLLGATLPGNLLPASHLNQRGFWESVDVIRCNNAALAQAGVAWHDFARIPDAVWEDKTRWLAVGEEIDGILSRDLGGESLFVVKDPRLCRLVPLWIEVLRRQRAEAKFVLVLRHPAEAAASLLAAQMIHPARGLLLWLRYALDAERHSRGYRRTVVSFPGLLEDWRSCVGRWASDLGESWPIGPDEAAEEIREFLTAGLRHHAAASTGGGDDELASWIGRVWSSLARAASDGSFDPGPSLDAVRGELDAAEEALTAEVFAPVLRHQLETVHADRDAIARQLAESQAALAGAHGQLEAVTRERDEVASREARCREELDSSARVRHERDEALKREAASKEQLDVLMSSRSWKLTGPLRRLGRLLRGG